ANSSGEGRNSGTNLNSPIGSSLYLIGLLINCFTSMPVTRADDAYAARSIGESNGENPSAFAIGTEL
ncbi:MAG: hypothetical protein RLN82_10200, partial [Pseudomonadales bacterium]